MELTQNGLIAAATKLVTKNLKLFNKHLNIKIQQPLISNKFITMDINPSLQGTILDTCFSWILNNKVEIFRNSPSINVAIELFIPLQRKYKKVMKKIYQNHFQDYDLETDNGLKNLLSCLFIASNITTFCRSGWWREEYVEQIFIDYQQKDCEKSKILTSNNLTIFKKLVQRLKTKAQKIKKYTIIDNPVFGFHKNIQDLPNFEEHKFTDQMFFVAIGADGDYLYGKTLGDMKSSKNARVQINYLYQLIFYYYLNVKHHKPIKYQINQFEIYNPLWNTNWKIKVSDCKIKTQFIQKIVKNCLYELATKINQQNKETYQKEKFENL